MNLIKPNSMPRTIFKILGMHCGSCVKIIKMELDEQAGVSNVAVDLKLATASLEFDPSKINLDEIKTKIEGLGYKVS